MSNSEKVCDMTGTESLFCVLFRMNMAKKTVLCGLEVSETELEGGALQVKRLLVGPNRTDRCSLKVFLAWTEGGSGTKCAGW